MAPQREAQALVVRLPTVRPIQIPRIASSALVKGSQSARISTSAVLATAIAAAAAAILLSAQGDIHAIRGHVETVIISL